MIKAVVSDFSRVLLFPRDVAHEGGLNKLHAYLAGRFAEYSVLDHFELNRELMSFYGTLKGEYRLAIFTTGMIQNAPTLKEEIDAVFEKVYAANELGWDKKNSRSYELLAESFEVLPTEIIYVDDNTGNVGAAAAAGCHAIRYESNVQAIKEMKETILCVK